MPPQLRLRNVDILVADPVVCCSQEADAFAHDLQDAAAQFDAFFLRLCFAYHHGEGLFFQAVGMWNVQSLCHTAQF